MRVTPFTAVRPAAPIAAVWLAAVALLATSARAEEDSQRAPNNNPNRRVTASASIDMVVRIGKFVFLRVGNTGTGISTVTFNGAASIPAGGVTAVNGNGTPVAWDGIAPAITFTPSGTTVLPVQVQSNAGQVSLTASVVSPLTSGGNVIPMSQLTVSSSNAQLPAPAIPAAGAGTPVNVAGTSFGGLVTAQSANWTFSFADPVSRPAGNYTGQLAFTASAP